MLSQQLLKIKITKIYNLYHQHFLSFISDKQGKKDNI
jgi:hypothetical protein